MVAAPQRPIEHWARRLLAREATDGCAGSRRDTAAWAALLVALLVGAALHLGVADWYTSYPATAPDGSAVRLPSTFLSVDHPFHIARARASLDALRDGGMPRWYAFHQGGFPAEFYPPGGSLLVALVSILGFGHIPLPIAHKLVVIAILFLPPLAYWAIARRARLPAGVAVLAAAWHLGVPGEWFGGGSRELLEQGLMANVLAAYLLPFVLLWGADWLRRGSRWGLVLAAGLGALTIYTNPRSILGLAATCLAVTVAALGEGMWPRPDRATLASVAARASALGLIIALLASALVLPLRATQDLYAFEHYVGFNGPFDIARWYSAALRLPLLLGLAGIGLVVAAGRRGFFGRALALQLLLTLLAIQLAGWHFRDSALFAQLEGPRLMPLLRPATIFLAALGTHELLRATIGVFLPRRAAPLAGGALLAATVLALFSPLSPIDREHRGLPHFATTDQPAFAAVAESALWLQALSTPSDRPLVLGNPLARHTSFWFAILTDRATFQGDWLWGWRDVGYGKEGKLRDERGALAPAFLAQHGLTMVVIAQESQGGALRDYADTLPYLRRLHAGGAGGYAIYRVAAPPGPANGWVALDTGVVHSLRVSPEQLAVEGRTDHPGAARFVVNAYPGWRASVNGAAVPIVESPEGYITVPVPAGEVSIRLEYAVTPIGWRARGMVGGGALLLLAVSLLPSLGARRSAADAATAKLPFEENEEGYTRVDERRGRSDAGFEIGEDESPLPGGNAGTIDDRDRAPGGPEPGPPQPVARFPSRR